MRRTRSRSARGVIAASSKPRSTAPRPSGRNANIGCSSGVSDDTKVSMLYTRTRFRPCSTPNALAPSSPPSSRVLNTKMTLCVSVAGSMRCIACSNAVDPVRSSLPRPVSRVPANRVACLYAVTAEPTRTPRAARPAESTPNHAVTTGSGLLRAESRGTNTPRSDALARPDASLSKCSIAG